MSSPFHWRRRVALGTAIVVLGLGLASCGDDDSGGAPSSTAGRETDESARQVACDRLAELGDVILSVRSAPSTEEVRNEVQAPFDAFVEAARSAGDEQLVDLAERARERFEVYLNATNGLDAREAGDDADVALDRSIQRCVELGVTTEFPREPT